MESLEAKILLKNLLKRIRSVGGEAYELQGGLTDDEVSALKFALSLLGGEPGVSAVLTSDKPNDPEISGGEEVPQAVTEEQNVPAVSFPDEQEGRSVFLDLSVLDMVPPPSDRRLCIDFGTAMSKVSLVHDETDKRIYEQIHVMELGVPGDQEEVSQTMLISSVYIDNSGRVWFGNKAVEYSRIESQTSNRRRLDNIKRYLSEEGLHSPVSDIFNPTDVEITYGDMILAYLTFLTWSVNQCTNNLEEPRNLLRRYAMPCFDSVKSRDVLSRLREMLGRAQILADTFSDTLHDGVDLREFMEAVTAVRAKRIEFPYIDKGVSEPLGVAGSIMSWAEDMNSFLSLIMVVDVGAGTSDFSMFKLGYKADSKESVAVQVEGSAEGITEAGNYLDQLLKGSILKKAGVDSSHPEWININGSLEMDLRDHKETLFRDKEIRIPLFNGELVYLTLEEFLDLEQVAKFGDSLKKCRDNILNRIDDSFIGAAPGGRVTLVLTGGGASLPMVKDLAQGSIVVGDRNLQAIQAKEFPQWLADDYPDLEADYPRISVSLGGARRNIISDGGAARFTAGDVKQAPKLNGYFSKGV